MSWVATLALGAFLGATAQSSWASVKAWWWPAAACPAGLVELAAEVRGYRDASQQAGFSSQLAANLAVGAVIAASILGLWALDEVRRAARPTAVTPCLTAAAVHTSAPVPLLAAVAAPASIAAPVEYDISADDDLDALESNELALASYTPVA